ncbi:MAG: hypothetical protein KF712_21865 [Akkermansiaceae bacterium]|nr:hypothetical protein [Akkermansiaceae bacterium]
MAVDDTSFSNLRAFSSDEIAPLIAFFDRYDTVVPYQGSEVTVPIKFSTEDLSLNARLLRGAENHAFAEEAFSSRYRIWAETLRGILLSVEGDLAAGKVSNATSANLIRSLNSVAAFCEVLRAVAAIEDRA